MKVVLKFLGVSFLGILFTSGAAFFDISQEDPDRHTFEHMRDVNIMRNFADGNFQPANLVTKAEGLTYALRAGGIAIPAEFDATTLPHDVDPNSWEASVIMRARELKITDPNAINFGPSQPILKAEFLAYLFRATKVDFRRFKSETTFVSTDVAADSWFAPHFRYAGKYGVAHQTTDGHYLPFKALSRREVAVLTFRQLRLFHGDDATWKFIELQAHIDQFVSAIQDQNQEEATAHLQKILTLSRAVTLQRNDKNAVAATALSRSLKHLVVSLRAMKTGRSLQAVESLLLASNQAERAALKSEEIKPAALQISRIVDETLNNFRRPALAYEY